MKLGHPNHIAWLVLLAALAVPRGALAQAPRPHRLELSAVAGLVSPGGDDFNGVQSALGMGATLRLRIAGPISVGVGYHYSDHGIETLPEHLKLGTVFGEARYTMSLRTVPADLFAGVRAGRIHESITIVDWTADGSVIGGLVGARYRLSRSLGLELQVSETSVHLGDRDDHGTVMAGTAASGSALGVQAGVSFRF